MCVCVCVCVCAGYSVCICMIYLCINACVQYYDNIRLILASPFVPGGHGVVTRGLYRVHHFSKV